MDSAYNEKVAQAAYSFTPMYLSVQKKKNKHRLSFGKILLNLVTTTSPQHSKTHFIFSTDMDLLKLLNGLKSRHINQANRVGGSANRSVKIVWPLQNEIVWTWVSEHVTI